MISLSIVTLSVCICDQYQLLTETFVGLKLEGQGQAA